jgi:hypothetical protein
VIGVQVAQPEGIDLARIQVAVERAHGARTAVEKQREGPIVKWRLH